MQRREFLKIAIAGAAGFAVGSLVGLPIRKSGMEGVSGKEVASKIQEGSHRVEALKVYNWSYYIQELLLDIFAKEVGMDRKKLVYDVFEDPSEPFSKIAAGGSGYDLVVLPDAEAALAISKGFVRRLDKSLIPNLRFVDPDFLHPPFDPDNEYSVVYMWGITAYSWRSDFVPKGVTTLKQIFDPELDFLKKHGKRVMMLEEAMEVVLSTKAYLGKDPYDWSDKTMEEVKEVLIRQKPYLAGYGGTSEYYRGFAEGSIDVAQAYNGDIALLRTEEHPELADKVQFGIPEEGGTRWTDNMLIPKDAPHPEAAHLFINFLLDPAVAAVNSLYVKYMSPVKDAKPLIEKVLSDPEIYPANIKDRTWYVPLLTEEDHAKLMKVWKEVQES
ncbi:MAG: spermidine/putrescine ABC transporter substrate-binding protein [Candidatus Korarchaeota archaeon]|nr:spermidine/putrescine ABC transporter substrate-binding protein [Candidatus Korarchaeota archaeon]